MTFGFCLHRNVGSLILGITNRALGEFNDARRLLLLAASGKETELTGTWMIPMAHFEVAVLAMLEVRVLERESPSDTSLKSKWTTAIDDAAKHLDEAAARLGETDLSSRLESRIAMVGHLTPRARLREPSTDFSPPSFATSLTSKRPRLDDILNNPFFSMVPIIQFSIHDSLGDCLANTT